MYPRKSGLLLKNNCMPARVEIRDDLDQSSSMSRSLKPDESRAAKSHDMSRSASAITADAVHRPLFP